MYGDTIALIAEPANATSRFLSQSSVFGALKDGRRVDQFILRCVPLPPLTNDVVVSFMLYVQKWRGTVREADELR